MALNEEEIKGIKEHLFKQIEKFPDEQREAAKQQIESMDASQLEEFLEKNKLIKKSGEQGGGCVFCSIAKGETPSHKIDENKSAIAVLDINPLSKAHSLIIAKKHETIEKSPSSVLSLAKKIAKRISSKFKPEEVKIESASVQGHGIINIIPIYKNQKLEKKKAEEKELQELQEKLKKKEREKKSKKVKSIEELPLAPIRVP